MTIAAKVVEDVDEAIAHIRQYGSNHTDCILAEDATRPLRGSSNVSTARS